MAVDHLLQVASDGHLIGQAGQAVSSITQEIQHAGGKAGPHVEGLLHLGALAVAFVVAYLGLDRFRHAGSDPVETWINEVRSRAKQSIADQLLLGENGEFKGPQSIKSLLRTRLLCDVARVQLDCKKGKGRFAAIMWFFARLWHYPGLLTFSKRLHIWGIRVLGCLTAASFVTLVGYTLWPETYAIVAHPWFVKLSFSLYVAVPMLIVVMAATARPFVRRVVKKLDLWIKETVATLQGELEYFNQDQLASVTNTRVHCPAVGARDRAPQGCPLNDHNAPPLNPCALLKGPCVLGVPPAQSPEPAPAPTPAPAQVAVAVT